MKSITTVYLALILTLFGSSNLLAVTSDYDSGSIRFAYDEDHGDVSLEKDVEDDYLIAGDEVSYKGIFDDGYLFGRKVNFDGETIGGMFAFGDEVTIDGEINGNMHGAADRFRINGILNETTFVAGESVIISEGAIVNGTLYSGANNIHIIGKLNNGLFAGAGEVVIDGPIKGDVNVRVGKLRITERGSIDGNLIYDASNRLSDTEKERVTGEVLLKKYKDPVEADDFKDFILVVCIITVLAVCITGLLLLLLPGVKTLFNEDRTFQRYVKTLLWGLLPVFIFPVLIIVTIPLLPLSIALSLSVFPLFLVTLIFGLTLSGQQLFKLFKWGNRSLHLQFLFAFVIFIVLGLIPILDILVLLAVTALGAGIILKKLFKANY